MWYLNSTAAGVKITVFWDLIACSLKKWLPPYSGLKMKAAGSSQMSVPIYKTKWCHTTWDCNLGTYQFSHYSEGCEQVNTGNMGVSSYCHQGQIHAELDQLVRARVFTVPCSGLIWEFSALCMLSPWHNTLCFCSMVSTDCLQYLWNNRIPFCNAFSYIFYNVLQSDFWQCDCPSVTALWADYKSQCTLVHTS